MDGEIATDRPPHASEALSPLGRLKMLFGNLFATLRSPAADCEGTRGSICIPATSRA